MSAKDKKACKCLLVKNNLEIFTTNKKEDEEDESDSLDSPTDEIKKASSGYFERCKQRRKSLQPANKNEFIDCRFLASTSNSCERAFSSAKHILVDSRKGMSPMMFEALLYLKFNADLWDAQMVATAIHGSLSDRSKELKAMDANEYYQSN